MPPLSSSHTETGIQLHSTSNSEPISNTQNPEILESNFASAFQHAAIGMTLVSLEGRFMQVNRALQELTGYSEAELMSLTFQDITHPEDLSADLAFLEQLLRGEITSYRMEKRYFHRDGHIIWVLLNVSMVSDGAKRPLHFVSQIQDITERKHVEAELLASQLELKTLVENVPDIITRFNTDMRVLYINPYIEKVSGQKRELFIGKTLEEAGVPFGICEAYREAWQIVVSTRQSARMEYGYPRPEGMYHYQIRMIPEFDDKGTIISYLSVSHDITRLHNIQKELLSVQKQLEDTNAALARQNDELEILALHDSLTGVKNRRAFDARLAEEVAHALRKGIPFCLALVDIDHFKVFNDTFGHGLGDQALIQVARLLETTLRPSDIVARYGGEEFALILTYTDPVGGAMATERCRQAIESFDWPHTKVTISAGVTNWEGEDANTLLRQADQALYEAKQSGRNCVRVAK